MRHPWHLDVDGNGKPSHKLCKHLPQMQTWRAYRFGHGSLARTRFWRLDFIRRTRRTSPGRHFEIYVDNPSQVPVSRQVSQSNPIQSAHNRQIVGHSFLTFFCAVKESQVQHGRATCSSRHPRGPLRLGHQLGYLPGEVSKDGI